MSKTKIRWATKTVNPLTGCTKISPGCKFCYAEFLSEKYKERGMAKYAEGFSKVVFHERVLKKLLVGKDKIIFLNSMADTFHEDVSLEIIKKIFDTIKASKNEVLVLTKRYERALALSSELEWPDNLWMGFSVTCDKEVDAIDILRQIPAKTRFLSIEPLIEQLRSPLPLEGIHWVIVGGESGHKARPMDLAWARPIQKQCLVDQIPFFYKQNGGRGPKKGGMLLDGVEYSEWPKRGIGKKL